MNKPKEFVNGLIVKAPHPNAPEFVKARIAINREDLVNWLRERTDQWINLDIKVSKKGKWYADMDDYKPKPKNPTKESLPDFDDDIPF